MKNLFFDRLKGIVDQVRRESSTTDLVNLFGLNLENLIDDAKIFYINAAVVDSLIKLSPRETNFNAIEYLPFNVIYFEFSDAIEIQRTSNLVGNIKGVLVSNLEDSLNDTIKKECFGDRDISSEFSGFLFYENKALDVILFSINDIQEYVNQTESSYQSEPNLDVNTKSFRTILRLTCNLIDYINAHNVVIHEQQRKIMDDAKLSKVNQKRASKNKKPLKQLKPYYWIKIRDTEVVNGSSISEGSELTYREWVRGHFQRYHTKNGVVRNWIDPYSRGPEDAPWREKRYEVLDDKLKKGFNPLSED